MYEASGRSMTSADSVASVTRSAIRRDVLAWMSAVTTPPGRWVARMRWMPSERPRLAMSTSPVMKSGSSLTMAANSSMTSTSRGSGAGGSARPRSGLTGAPPPATSRSREARAVRASRSSW